ncbi:cytochrome P450 [Streptomyces sp. QTS52]
MQVMRVVARRDLTVAVGHGKTYLGGVCVWISGTAEQARGLAAGIRAGVPVSLALTERAHGSDLLAGDVRGEADGEGGWRVSGEKWLINNAIRGSVLSVLTRTAEDGGPRGFTVLLVDKRRLAEGDDYRCLDKIRTHGIRGADISGIAFDAAPVPADAAVGGAGGGVETVLKALQLTRTLCASLSLGAADHALSIALDFAERRELFGRRLIDLPQARHVLASAAADVLVGEALATVAARSVHTVPDELSVVAAATNAAVASANQDPDRFGEDPGAFDPARPSAGAHLALGHGAHFCLGAALARAGLQIAVSSLIRRFPRLAPADDVDNLTLTTGMMVHALSRMPVTW